VEVLRRPAERSEAGDGSRVFKLLYAHLEGVYAGYSQS
jgi:hypothetical protein